MKYTGQQFAGDLVHIGDHQKQSLGSGIGRGECAGCQGAVDRPRCASFGLHFNDFDLLSEQVFLSVGRHLVYEFGHGRGWCDRKDCSHIRKCIRHVCCSSVSVHGFHLLCHYLFSFMVLFYEKFHWLFRYTTLFSL